MPLVWWRMLVAELSSFVLTMDKKVMSQGWMWGMRFLKRTYTLNNKSFCEVVDLSYPAGFYSLIARD